MRRSRLVFLLAFALVALGAWTPSHYNKLSKEPEETIEGITVEGSESFRTGVRNALALLRAKAYYDLVEIQASVKRIESSPTDQSYISLQRVPPTIMLSVRAATGSVTRLAGTLAHEACHAKSNQELRANGSPVKIWNMTSEERKCIDVAVETLKKVGAPESEYQWLRQQDGKHWDKDGDGRLTSKDRLL